MVVLPEPGPPVIRACLSAARIRSRSWSKTNLGFGVVGFIACYCWNSGGSHCLACRSCTSAFGGGSCDPPLGFRESHVNGIQESDDGGCKFVRRTELK